MVRSAALRLLRAPSEVIRIGPFVLLEGLIYDRFLHFRLHSPRQFAMIRRYVQGKSLDRHKHHGIWTLAQEVRHRKRCHSPARSSLQSGAGTCGGRRGKRG